MAVHLFWLPVPARAQETQESPAAAAERENTEANLKQVNVKMELIEEALRTQQRRIGALVNEIHALREDVDRMKSRNESAATQESIKRLAEKIEEVDRKRRDDNELVLAQLKAIGKGLTKPPPPQREPTPAPPPSATKQDDPAPQHADAPPENGYIYKIKDGDTLVRIVTDLRKQGFKVTQKQVMDANPKVNWTRLKIGQSIFIPQPAP